MAGQRARDAVLPDTPPEPGGRRGTTDPAAPTRPPRRAPSTTGLHAGIGSPARTRQSRSQDSRGESTFSRTYPTAVRAACAPRQPWLQHLGQLRLPVEVVGARVRAHRPGRRAGLGFEPAARTIQYLITESLRRGISGVGLKDERALEGAADPSSLELPGRDGRA